jgi:putative ABC transport system substrate-binding protein
MRRLGWTEGGNVAYDAVFADDRIDEVPRRGRGSWGRAPDLIFAPPTVVALSPRSAPPRTIPIVFGTTPDPVAVGLVDDLAHPGGNVTGVAPIAETLVPKRVELLRDTLLHARRIGVIHDPRDAASTIDRRALVAATQRLDLALVEETLLSESDIGPIFQRLAAAHVDAVLTTASTQSFNLRVPLCEAALRWRLPLMGQRTEMADAGALLAYSSSQDEQLRRAAQLVDKILRGARPSDIPIEQPTVFELVVNLRTARALGVKVPSDVLLRAARVIDG